MSSIHPVTMESIQAIRKMSDTDMVAFVLAVAVKDTALFNEVLAIINAPKGSVSIEVRNVWTHSVQKSFNFVLSNKLMAELGAMPAGHIVAAIKLVRAETGAGLHESKAAVEYLACAGFIPRNIVGTHVVLPDFVIATKL
jgi:ribosomal protein L7/L12